MGRREKARDLSNGKRERRRKEARGGSGPHLKKSISRAKVVGGRERDESGGRESKHVKRPQKLAHL